jgi:hypothetical protein
LRRFTARPRLYTIRREDYYTRKACYALNGMVVCDDQRRIRYFICGWPGSAHDQRVLRNSTLHTECDSYFKPYQYVFGDSAFTPTRHFVPAFKKLPNCELPFNQEGFNKALAHARIIVEHTIGMLKGRFQSLKCLQKALLDNGESLLKIISFIEACVILHNICVLDSVPLEWI